MNKSFFGKFINYLSLITTFAIVIISFLTILPQVAHAQDATPDATLIVKKVVYDPSYNLSQNIASDSTNFQFNVNGLPATIQGNQQQTFSVTSGTNTVVEVPDPSNNYFFWGCSADSAFIKDAVANGLSVDISPGQTVTVTCINSQKPARITLQKVVLDSNGNPVSDNTQFAIQINNGPDWFVSETISPTVSNINPGIISVTETSNPNYESLGCALPNNSPETSINLPSGADTAVICTNKQKPGTISGTKFKSDGITPIPNFSNIILSTCTDNTYLTCILKTSQATDLNGNYKFTDLTTGFYQVSENSTGYTPVGNTSYNMQITPGLTVADRNFSNFKNIDITVCTLQDVDGNNLTTSDQSPAPGFEIQFSTGADQTTGANGCTTFANLGPGSYSSFEILFDGWTSMDPFQFHDFGQAVDGQNQTLTYINHPTGTILVRKMVDINADGNFVSGDNGDFTWNIDGIGAVSTGSVNPRVNIGNHNIGENQVVNYHFVGWFPSNTGYSCTSLPVGNQYLTLPIPVNVNVNETSDFTICNARDLGALTVHKMLDSGNGTFVSADRGTLFNWSLDGAVTNLFGATINNVLSGTHTISENSVSGYHFVGWYPTGSAYTCTSTPNKTLPITFNVVGNLSNQVTLCNQKDAPVGGTITIDKITLPSGDLTKFKIDLLQNNILKHESVLADQTAPDTYFVNSGSYTLKEQSTKGWTLAFTYCVSSNKNHTNISINNFSISTGEHIACSFVNIKSGKLTLSQITQIINDLLALLKKLFG